MPPPAFCVARTFPAEPSATFRFDRHYLLDALKGSMRLEAAGRCWSLPPARAAWIAAGADITVTLERPVEVCSLLFAPGHFARPRADLRGDDGAERHALLFRPRFKGVIPNICQIFYC